MEKDVFSGAILAWVKGRGAFLKVQAGTGKADCDAIHPGNEFAHIRKEDTVLEAFGGAVEVMRGVVHIFFCKTMDSTYNEGYCIVSIIRSFTTFCDFL